MKQTSLSPHALRPRLSKAVAVLGAAAALALAPLGAAQAQVAARPADSFVESIGVNTHWEYGSYANYAGLKTLLGASGIRYVRDGSSPNIRTKLNDLYATYGIRTNVLLGRRFPGPWPKPLDPSQITAELTDIKGITPAAVVSLEDPNEYDISHGGEESNWVTKIKTYTVDVHTKVKADAALRTLPLIGPSFTSPGAYQGVGNLDSWIDYANIHLYQSWRHPGNGGWGDNGYGSIPWALTYLAGPQTPAGKPVQSTECGYHNDYGRTENGYVVENEGISEEAEGKYTARMFAEFFRQGIVRSFKYELLNQGTGYKENVFGLLRNDLTEKPSYRAVKNLIAVLADPGASFTPASLAYTLTGNTANVRQVLLQKRNGDFYLLLWQEVPSWVTRQIRDTGGNLLRTEHENLYPAAQSVTLTVPGTIMAATKYELTNNADLTTATVPITSNALTLAVTDKVMMVKLTTGPSPLPTFNGTYRLLARHSGKALDVSGVSTADGAAIHQWTYGGWTNQHWQITPVSNGFYKLIAQHSGKALDVAGAGTANGTRVHQWTDNGLQAQRWKIEPTSDGYYKLTVECSGKALDVSGVSTANGASVHQWDYVGGLNQQWKLELVPASRLAAAVPTTATPTQTAASLQVYPNPNPGKATLTLTATRPQRVVVNVHDQKGHLVSRLTVPAQAGRTDLPLPAGLAPGTYHLRAIVDGQPQQFTLQVE